MDEKIEDLLSFPDTNEAIFKASMPKLTQIFGNLKKAYKRDYKRQIYTKEELDIRGMACSCIALINSSVLMQYTLEMALITQIFPILNIVAFNFNGNLFYAINNISGYSLGYWIFSEMDIQNLCRSTNAVAPKEGGKLTAIQNFYRLVECTLQKSIPKPAITKGPDLSKESAPAKEGTKPTVVVDPTPQNRITELADTKTPDHSKEYTLQKSPAKLMEELLSAILYWHHNKIHNVKDLYSTWKPFYAYHVEMLRTIPLAFFQYYWLQSANAHSSIIYHYPKEDRDKVIQTSVPLLKLGLPNPRTSPPHVDMEKYIQKLHEKLNEKTFDFIRRLLWGLSRGNISEVKSFLDMIATVYLGHDYIKTATSNKTIMYIIHCEDIQVVSRLLKSIFSYTFTLDNEDLITYAKLHPIYSCDSPSTLAANLTSSDYILKELNGGLVNISVDTGENDLGHLKKIAETTRIKYKEDKIFKTLRFSPSRYYIHITDTLYTSLPTNAQRIELIGDIANKAYKFENIHAETIILLSLLNFFAPTSPPTPKKSQIAPSFTNENEIAQKFIEDLFDDTTSKFTSESLEEAIEKWRNENKDTESYPPDISKAKNETIRAIAESIGILEEPHTKAKEIEVAFELWREHTPYPVANIKIIDVLKNLYNPLFYFKYSSAESRIETETQRNVRVFFGLALDTDKLDDLINKENISERDLRQRQEEFIQYYEDMVQNFKTLLPQIQKALLLLDAKMPDSSHS